jgi:hypothetical protein
MTKISAMLLAMLLAVSALALEDIALPTGGSFYDGKTLMPRKDAETTTTETSYTPRFIGDFLIGATSSTTTLWIATGLTTNDWSLVTATGGPFSAAQLVAGTVLLAVDASAVTNINAANILAGTVLSAVDASSATNIAAGNIASGNLALARGTNALAAYDLAGHTNGTLALARFSASLPAYDVSGFTNGSLEAARIATPLAAYDVSGFTNGVLDPTRIGTGYGVVILTNKSDIGIGYTNIITFIGTVSGTLAP